MQTNILEYMENIVKKVPDKAAFVSEDSRLTFRQVSERCQKIGTYLLSKGASGDPVIIYMRKSPEMLTAFWGTVYAGCFYVPIDEEMPKRRIQLILENTEAKYLLYDDAMASEIEQLDFQGRALSYMECLAASACRDKLDEVRRQALDTDPVYILFTSGSTGVPKGVVGHHRGVIDYIESLSGVLQFDESTVFGNQTPLYLDACMKEIYPTLKYGATTYFIPKSCFMFPVKLVEYLNDHQINTICWVVSALTMISAFGAFNEIKPRYLRLVAFASEVFPVKQFNIWKSALPQTEFYNLYGSTETTGVSCYYHVEDCFEETSVIPIGRPFPNTEVLLLSEEGKPVCQGERGEICIRGTCLTHGYYRNPQKTQEVFVQNPLHAKYPERIYKTGDIGYENPQGVLVFVSRKDDQIKHMGQRIELGEIEANVNLLDEIHACCCLYMADSQKIVLFYAGEMDKRQLTAALKAQLPRYMLPNAILRLDMLPMTANGKMDRMKMTEIYLQQQENRRLEKPGRKNDGQK